MAEEETVVVAEGTASHENTPFERIETLIPYKEPEWKPEQKLGKLDPRWHTWTAARKLGEYLLSGEHPTGLGELSHTCAAYLLDVERDDLTPVREDEIMNSERGARADVVLEGVQAGH